MQAVAVNGNHNHATQVTGTTNAYLAAREWDLCAGPRVLAGEMRGGKAVCIIGETVRKRTVRRPESRSARASASTR